jgi:hypothetical protein
MAGRFMLKGVEKIRFVTTAVNILAPTLAEIAAGIDLTADLAAMSGFMLKNNPIATPDLATTFDSTIGGNDTIDASTMDFYDRDNSATIRTGLAKGTSGTIVFERYGHTSGKRAELWPVTTTGVNDMTTVNPEAAKFQVSFSNPSVPNQNYTLP